MTTMRWDPWTDLAALQRDVAELFSRTPAADGARRAGLQPPIDAYRTDDGLVVAIDLPGLRPEDVDVAAHDGTLTITGERAKFDVPDDAWLRRERGVGLVERSFTLPDGTDPASIKASFDHGVLTLRIPSPPERRPQRIQIDVVATPHGSVEAGQTIDA